VTVRVGIIGAGAIARYHLQQYLATPQAQVVAICDVLPERAAALAAEFGIPAVDGDYAALLARPEVDAVSICTPNDSHAPAAIAAARAGKHVLCEKPLALSVAEAAAMLAAVEAAGVHHVVNFSKRPFPGIVRLAALLADGELGAVLQIETTYLQSWLLAPTLSGDPRRRLWRLDRRVAGSGVLGDLGSHQIDLAHHLVGPIRRVVGLLETKARHAPVAGAVDLATLDIDDHATFIADFGGGVSGTFVSSRVAAGTRDDLTVAVYGTRGAARFSNLEPERLAVCLGEANLKYRLWSELPCPLPPGTPPSLMAAFVRGIAAGAPATPTFADGLRCQAVLAAVEQSARGGAWVTVE
jgi:predicted dehydrogenase